MVFVGGFIVRRVVSNADPGGSYIVKLIHPFFFLFFLQMAEKESSLFDGDLWGTVEEENVETYTDVNGNERQERVQSLPPPSLTRGGTTSHSSHILERHTGTFTGRAVKGD